MGARGDRPPGLSGQARRPVTTGSCLLAACLATAVVLFAQTGSPPAKQPPSNRTAAKPAGKLELRGQVFTPQEKPLPGTRVVWVNLHGSTSPFSAQAQSLGGKFKFAKLVPGSYTLAVFVRGIGETRQTVEVSKSLADSKGRIEVKVVLQQSEVFERKRWTISARELSITPGAINEYQRAQKALGRREVDKAIGYLQSAIERSTAFVEAINLLGTICYQRREYSKAEELFRRALEYDENAYEPMVNLGGTLLNLSRFREALPFNVQSTIARPDDALAHAQLGMNLFALGHYDNAINYLNRAKKLDPAHFSHPQMTLAEIYMRKGEKDKAIAELEEFIRLHPDDLLAAKLREGLKRLKSQ